MVAELEIEVLQIGPIVLREGVGSTGNIRCKIDPVESPGMKSVLDLDIRLEKG